MLHEHAPGQFSEASPQQTTQPQQQPLEDLAVIPDEVIAEINSALEPFSDSALQAGTAVATLAAVGDATLEDVALSMARASGMEPTEARDRAQFVVNAYQAQADSYLTHRVGIDPQDLGQFYAYLRLSQKGALKNAVNMQVNGNSMKAWADLGSRWLSRTSPSHEAVKAAGYTVRGDEVQVDGKWLSIKAAARSGLL